MVTTTRVVPTSAGSAVTSTSATATSVASSATDRFPPAGTRRAHPTASCAWGRRASTLTTSAPASASNLVQYGPAMPEVRSSTRRPASGPTPTTGAQCARSVTTARPRYVPASSSSKMAGSSDRAPVRETCVFTSRRGEVDELPHVLDRADGRVDDGRFLHEELERVELELALAGGGQTDRDEQARLAQELHTEVEAGQLRREHQRRADTTQLAGHDLDRLVRADGELGTELAHEGQAVLTDVDADHPVAERSRELDGVVPEAPAAPTTAMVRPGSTPCLRSFFTAP